MQGAIIDLLVALECAGLAHRDLTASNISMRTAAYSSFEAVLIDLEGLSPMRWRASQTRHRQLVRLGASLVGIEGVTRTDAVRFVRHFASRIGSSELAWRSWMRRLTRDVAVFRERAQRRQRSTLAGYGGE